MSNHTSYLVLYNRSDPLWQVREGRARSGWVNEKVITGGVTTVLTDASLVVSIPEGYRAMITRMRYGVNTLQDTAGFEIGYTDKVDGSGTFTPICCKKHMTAGDKKNPYDDKIDVYRVPLMVKYADGGYCITIRVTPDSDDTTITCGFRLWLELDD